MKISDTSELFPLILLTYLHVHISIEAQTVTCPKGSYHIGSSCYIPHFEPKTRTKASEFCTGLNSSLFGIESEEEWTRIQEFFLSLSYGSLHVGKRFALAFPQIQEHSTDIKLVFVNAEQTDIQITVQYPNNTAETVSVTKNGIPLKRNTLLTCSNSCLYYSAGGDKPHSVEQYSVKSEWRVNKDDGRHVENKGIIISSGKSFRILVGNFKTGGDVYLPFPVETLGENPQNSFLIATQTPEEHNDYLGNMFVVTVFEQNTTVEVYNSEGETGPDALMLAVPPISWLRNEHVVPPLGGRPASTGYLVRIVSAEDDNHVSYHNASTVSPVEQTIQFGDYINYDHPFMNSTVPVRCTKACLVVQYNKGSGSDRSSDPFMMWIPPVNSYSIGDTYLSVFTGADGCNFKNYYSIVMYSPEHQANIMVDGAVVQTTQVPDWNRYRYYISDELPSAKTSITVSSPARYVVWMYGHKHNKGYGYLGTASKGIHGTGSYWTKARKQNDAWIWPPGVKYFNWHPYSSDQCTTPSCNYAVLTNTLTDTGLALQVQQMSYSASFMCEISASQIRSLKLSSTEKITNASLLTDDTTNTCASLRQNNNNNNNNNDPPILHLVHDYRINNIKLQIIFNQSTSCSKNEIFYVDSSHLSPEGCTSVLARKCHALDVKVTDDKQCNYECPCPGKVTCDIMMFNQNGSDIKNMEICEVFAYKT